MNALDRCFNIADVREAAKRRLPRGIFEFIDRGTEDDQAVANNRAAFERMRLLPRVAVDVSKRSTRTALFGTDIAMPLAIAPTGAAGLVWYQGELELARAAADVGIPFTLATRATTSIEDIARLAGGRLWFQLYIWRQREMSHELVERAQRAGFEALVVTLDVPVQPNREYNLRNGFSLPLKLTSRGMVDILTHPRWLFGTMGRYLATTGMPRYENQAGAYRENITGGNSARAAGMRGDDVSWSDVALLRKRWKGTLLVKGILTTEDAEAALENGADGVIVSNHGGRCLDSSVAPLEVLPEIVAAVGKRATVLLDGGIRRGSDIAKAVALGASAVLCGRPGLYGMGMAGRPGAKRVLDILQTELSTTLGMLGRPAIAELDASIVHRHEDFAAHPGNGPVDAPTTRPSRFSVLAG
ncbi:alpha-hydroxy-acid oxidizing protein [Verticiella sediminum]|uniref:Alpha-hydroxy-acid oxidizing protein n=1 Tax=Verticiella sediminum TaxID=1247510 RepID=A0A556AWR6_9BURK|nr:alpha-hydroxy acid oxidase [Verticiella sediminum]TSH97389.1 alpha-hydroxy-acid oxidizing protein [Verticiella sediminum]